MSTGYGFTFSSPIYYDGLTFAGNERFVRCAEEQKRYAECSALSICVEASTSYYAFLKRAFPSDYIRMGSSLEHVTKMLLDGECNVLASADSSIRCVAMEDDEFRERDFTVRTKMLTKEPHAIVTNNDDRAFSDAVNWVVRALMFGEEQGLAKDPSRCRVDAGASSSRAADLPYLNAVFCVGNYREILPSGLHNPGMNEDNRGTGMLYALPFGNLDRDTFSTRMAQSITLARLRKEMSLRCGLVVPSGFEGNVTDGLVGMGVDYCRALAASIFVGDMNALDILTFTETDDSSALSLANGTIDVLVGATIQQDYDFDTSPASVSLHFSTPYYYGNSSTGNDIPFYSIATRESDAMFCSFVNSIVLATIYAQEENIQKVDSDKMPFAPIFGEELAWALKDAIAYSGSYDEMYARNFGHQAYRGRNTVNKGGPLMLSLPVNHEYPL